MGADTKAELEARVARLEKSLTEALEREKATSEILRIISSSTTDIRPVFDAIVKSGLTLFQGSRVSLSLVRDGRIEPQAFADTERQIGLGSSLELNRDTPLGACISEARLVHVPDMEKASDRYPSVWERSIKLGLRSTLVAPLMRDGKVFGAIAVRRAFAGPFTDEEIALLTTFAAQAVIAIENVRLFNETKEALEQQTVISEILRVISSSPTDTQPVFDAIVKSGVHLFAGMNLFLHLVKGDHTELVASTLPIQVNVTGMLLADERSPASRTIFKQEIVQIPDIFAEEVPARLTQRAEQGGFRSLLSAPLLQEGKGIGAIQVLSPRLGQFTDKQVALLKTFAAQAVIAIENVRLFKELQARNAEITETLEQQTATAEILKVISSSPTDTQPVFDAVAESAARYCGAEDVVIRRIEGDSIRLVAHIGPVPVDKSLEVRPMGVRSITGRAIREGRILHLHDVAEPRALEEYPDTAVMSRRGAWYRTVLVAPLMREGGAIGAILLRRREIAPFSDRQIKLLETFSDQAVIAIENVRLFNEIQEKSRQLQIANQHKSEFLANMSHELRTPLNAVIGFSEVLQQGMVGAMNDKQGEYIEYIHKSGSHLLSLINDILDLSKVEAGRMELDLTAFNVPMAIDNALTLVKERASRHGLTLDCTLDPGVAEIHADERKFKQVMLNLLSNAVKFTPEGGQITVAARPLNDAVEIRITDTGIGIAPEDCAAVFEEFRQVGDSSERKAEGTGLGLALTKKFIELHGGRIWLTSTLAKGSTFSFTLPITQPAAQEAA